MSTDNHDSVHEDLCNLIRAFIAARVDVEAARGAVYFDSQKNIYLKLHGDPPQEWCPIEAYALAALLNKETPLPKGATRHPPLNANAVELPDGDAAAFMKGR